MNRKWNSRNGIESPILSYSDPIQFSQVPLLDSSDPFWGGRPNPLTDLDSPDHGNRTALVRCGSHASMTFCRTALEIGAQNRVQKPPQILYAKGPARKCGCDQRRALQRELQKKRESPANGVVESAGPPWSPSKCFSARTLIRLFLLFSKYAIVGPRAVR